MEGGRRRGEEGQGGGDAGHEKGKKIGRDSQALTRFAHGDIVFSPGSQKLEALTHDLWRSSSLLPKSSSTLVCLLARDF